MNFKVKALLAIAAVCASSFALAQNKNFTGFSAGLSANFANSNVEYSGANVGNPTLKASKADQNLSLQGQYGFGITDKIVVGLGMTYAIGELKAGTVNAGGSVDTKTKDMYSIDITPGYVVSSSTLAYLKLSYASAKGEASGAGVGNTLSSSLTGTGFGLGFRTMLTNTMYLQGEYVMTSYDKKTIQPGVDIKGDSGTVSIGIGYNF